MPGVSAIRGRAHTWTMGAPADGATKQTEQTEQTETEQTEQPEGAEGAEGGVAKQQLWTLQALFMLMSVVPPLFSCILYLALGNYAYEWTHFVSFPLSYLGICFQMLLNLELSPAPSRFELAHYCLWWFCAFPLIMFSQFLIRGTVAVQTPVLAVIFSVPFFRVLNKVRRAVHLHQTRTQVT